MREHLWKLVRVLGNGLSDLGGDESCCLKLLSYSSVQMYDDAMIAVVMTVDVACNSAGMANFSSGFLSRLV